MPAPTSVASWRVSTATSARRDAPKNAKKSMSRLRLGFGGLLLGGDGEQDPVLAQQRRAATFGFSASRTPFTALPVRDEDAAVLEDGHGRLTRRPIDVFLRRGEDLFDAGEAREHLARAVVAQGVHALLDRGALDASARRRPSG